MSRVRVGEESDWGVPSVKRVETGGVRAAVVRLATRWYAIEDRCSHDNGPLADGELIGEEIECPRHGARFGLSDGSARCLPAVKAVAVYPVAVEGGGVYLEIPRPT